MSKSINAICVLGLSAIWLGCGSKPMQLRFDNKSASVLDLNKNGFKSVTVEKFDSSGSILGDRRYYCIADSPAASVIFLLQDNSKFSEDAQRQFVFENGYHYRIVGTTIGSADTLEMKW